MSDSKTNSVVSALIQRRYSRRDIRAIQSSLSAIRLARSPAGKEVVLMQTTDAVIVLYAYSTILPKPFLIKAA